MALIADSWLDGIRKLVLGGIFLLSATLSSVALAGSCAPTRVPEGISNTAENLARIQKADAQLTQVSGSAPLSDEETGKACGLLGLIFPYEHVLMKMLGEGTDVYYLVESRPIVHGEAQVTYSLYRSRERLSSLLFRRTYGREQPEEACKKTRTKKGQYLGNWRSAAFIMADASQSTKTSILLQATMRNCETGEHAREMIVFGIESGSLVVNVD